MSRFARRNWFLIALVAVLAVGLTQHAALSGLVARIPSDPLLATILLAMSAPLDLRKALGAREALSAVAVGVVVNALAAPPLAWLLGRPLGDPLAMGLVVATLSPSTQASAAVWTRRGGGNEGVALAVSVVTNLLSFVTFPLGASLLLGRSQEVDPVRLGTKLLAFVVLPVLAGQALRLVPRVRLVCDRHRHGLSHAAQTGLLVMVLVGAVRSGGALESLTTGLGPGQWAGLAVASAAVHLSLFAVAWRLARMTGSDRAQALGAAVAGSQKTLAVGVGVGLAFGPLALLPMIVYHLVQLVLDTVLVERLGHKEPRL